jgi:hypothetical protein
MHFSELMETLSHEQKLHFYELFAHNMTVGIRGIWLDTDIDDSEKVERMKWANEVLHQITAKIWALRLKTHEWTETDFGSILEDHMREHPNIAITIESAVKHSYRSVTGPAKLRNFPTAAFEENKN